MCFKFPYCILKFPKSPRLPIDFMETLNLRTLTNGRLGHGKGNFSPTRKYFTKHLTIGKRRHFLPNPQAKFGPGNVHASLYTHIREQKNTSMPNTFQPCPQCGNHLPPLFVVFKWLVGFVNFPSQMSPPKLFPSCWLATQRKPTVWITYIWSDSHYVERKSPLKGDVSPIFFFLQIQKERGNKIKRK